MKKALPLLFLLLSLHCFSQNDTIPVALPEIKGYVNDFANIMELHEEIALNATITNFVKKYEIGIVVVTVHSIEPYETIFDYSLDLANKDKSGCVYMVVCKDCRKIQIQNCNLILDKLTNDETKKIIDDYILPEFKVQNYFGGIWKGVSEIMNQLY